MKRQNGLLRSTTAVFLLMAFTVPAEAQVDIDIPEGELDGRELQSILYLQLYGHPATAHRRLAVRVRDETVLLSGAVADESERRTAERLVSLIARDPAIVNRIEVRPEARGKPPVTTAFESPAEARAAFRKRLAAEIAPPILEGVTLAAYPVSHEGTEAGRGRAWVPVAEGIVPSVRHQVAISESLLSGSPPAAAVINRTYAVPSGRDGKSLRIRVPFFSLDLDTDEGGVDLGMLSPAGPFHLRTGSRPDPREDDVLLRRYERTVRTDPKLARAPLRPTVFGGVLTLRGEITAAEKMRAVALTRRIKGLRGIVDATDVKAGGPPYFRESDLTAYLAHRLHEHANVWDMRQQRMQGQHIVRGTVPTRFHAKLGASVLAHDPALADLPLKPEFTEWNGRKRAGPPSDR